MIIDGRSGSDGAKVVITTVNRNPRRSNKEVEFLVSKIDRLGKLDSMKKARSDSEKLRNSTDG
jgi:hypothetical protein